MYWLRRIPAETRIVVLVVFLALFQALLLSVFGLSAIREQRRTVAEKMDDRARSFLRNDVVAGFQNEVRDLADDVLLKAYVAGAEGWRDNDAGGGLFTDAFLLTPDESILSSTGRVLLLSPERAVADDRAARATANLMRLEYSRELDEENKPERDLRFAETHPFARDEFGRSLALLFAETPRLVGEGTPGVAALLRMRLIGLLNQLAEFAAADEVELFLARIDRAGADVVGFAEGVREQDRQIEVLHALKREARALSPQPNVRSGLHRNLIGKSTIPFYVRQRGGGQAIQVLAVDRDVFHARIKAFERNARRRAVWHRPSIVPGTPAEGEPFSALPGYVAKTVISPEARREEAGGRERIYWYIIAVSVAGILAGGFLTARVVMREMKLAKLKSGFVSNVSHELKTPLTSIRMFAEMLGSGKVTEEAERQECLTVITQETDRLGALIQQVLDFGRLQSRQRRFHWTVASAAPVVAREVERFRRATGLDEERFVVRVAANLPAVRHDPAAFGEVVANLLSNAYKYTPADDKQIRLEIGPRQGRVTLSVDDNGPGVSVRERRRIFEQFYRADDLVTRDVEGTGLGLSIARNIVRAHGGRILVEDSDLGGARFLVVLMRQK